MSTDGVDGAGHDGGSNGNENSEPSISEEAQGALDGGSSDGDGSADTGLSGTDPEDEAEEEQHSYDEVGIDVSAPDLHEPTPAERAASQERMQAEAQAARQAYEAQQEGLAADLSYPEAMDQEIAAQNAAVEAVAAETAMPGTYADTHLSQGLSGVNEGLANVLGGPVDLVEMGLNGLMAAAEYVGVPESITPELSGSFLGSDQIAGLMADFGAIGPESADPARQTTRAVAEAGTEVVSAAVGAGLASRGAAIGQAVDDVVVDGSRAVDLELSYMPGWTAAQRAAADSKATALTEADTIVTVVERAATSLRARYTREVGDIPDNADLDHIQDLQLGGLDDILNVGPLDSSVNRSLGAQINHRISDLEIGTPIGRVRMGER